MSKTNEQLTMQISRNTILGNIALSAFKLAAGLLGRSAAMLSDAVHSLSDVLSTVVVIIGIKLANQKADREHPYEHERFECVAAILLATILCATGLGIGYGGLQTILSGSYGAISIPGKLALIAAVGSIVAKEGMYWYTRAAAQKIHSSALMADAWHHRSDALSSIGSFVGIWGARMGFPVLDSVACLLISLFIVKAAVDIFRNATGKMTDRACSSELEAQLHATILRQEKVLGVDLLRTRIFGDKVYVDVEICVNRDAPLYISHEIAHHVHDAIKAEYSYVKHCMVHVNPAGLTLNAAEIVSQKK